MLKLSISWDEIGITHNTPYEDAYDKIGDFLTDQFPEWDLNEAFDFDSIEFDADNNEVSILMYNIKDFKPVLEPF